MQFVARVYQYCMLMIFLRVLLQNLRVLLGDGGPKQLLLQQASLLQE